MPVSPASDKLTFATDSSRVTANNIGLVHAAKLLNKALRFGGQKTPFSSQPSNTSSSTDSHLSGPRTAPDLARTVVGFADMGRVKSTFQALKRRGTNRFFKGGERGDAHEGTFSGALTQAGRSRLPTIQTQPSEAEHTRATKTAAEIDVTGTSEKHAEGGRHSI